jgi:hypothetical protein
MSCNLRNKNLDYSINDEYKKNESVDESFKDQNICTRFIRKKYRCIIIFLLVIISISELFNNLISRIDKTSFEFLLNQLFYSNSSGIGYRNNTNIS